eukprot:1586845-Amphidinium_carterae.2
MAVLDVSWAKLCSLKDKKLLPASMAREYLLSAVLVPLAVTDLKLPLSTVITASDASLTGGAVSSACDLSQACPSSLPSVPPILFGTLLLE